jgi:hypothetical protein
LARCRYSRPTAFAEADRAAVFSPGTDGSASVVQPPSATGYALDEPVHLQYVLVVLDSVEDVDPNAGAPAGAPPWPGEWDILLDAALTEIGLQAAGTPDWLWFRTGTPD